MYAYMSVRVYIWVQRYKRIQHHFQNIFNGKNLEDGGETGGSRVHFPLAAVKHIADLRNRANSQRYSSIYEDRRPKIEDIERSEGKKSA